jgi:hypothetical protein
MIQLCTTQKNWLKNRFLSEIHFPNDFMNDIEFLELLCGCPGDQYEGHDFDLARLFDFCTCVLQTNERNRILLLTAFRNISEIRHESEQHDFFELEMNLSDVIKCFKDAVHWVYDVKCEIQLAKILKKLNIFYCK